MIAASSRVRSLLTGSDSYVMRTRVESWYGRTLLDDDVPVDAGQEDYDRTLRIPERVTLTVPRMRGTTTYAPITTRSPLAAYGQRLRVLVGLETRPGVVEWVQRGWFVVTDSEARGDEVTVQAAGLLWLIDEARLVAPFQPTGTFKSAVRSLLEPALPVDLSTAPTDRAVPGSIQFDENRLDGLNALLDAWPAAGYVTEQGVFKVTSTALPAVIGPIDETNRIIRLSAGSSRDGAYNAVVTRGTAPDGGVVQGVAYDTAPGPLAYGGAFNPLPVPLFFDSPLLTTVAQCNAAAVTRLATIRRQAGRSFTVDIVPDPTLVGGDRFLLSYGTELADVDVSIEALTVSLTAGVGVSKVSLRENS